MAGKSSEDTVWFAALLCGACALGALSSGSEPWVRVGWAGLAFFSAIMTARRAFRRRRHRRRSRLDPQHGSAPDAHQKGR